MRAAALPCTVWDANLEGLMFVLGQRVKSDKKRYWDAARQSRKNINMLKTAGTYANADQYRLSVRQLGFCLEKAGEQYGVKMGMADYQHERLSPVRMFDLFSAAERPETNPFFPHFKAHLDRFLEKESVRIVGLSITFLSQALTAFAMIGYIRRMAPEIRILLGGGLVTTWLRNTGLENPFGVLVDACRAGSGENALLALHGKTLDKVQGILPDYSQFVPDDYLSPGRILPFNFTHGCYWRKCSFCPENAEKNPHGTASAGQPMEDLEALVQSTQPRLIHFLDNAIPPSFLSQLIERDPRVPWYGYVRFIPELEDLDFCMALRRSGCLMLQLGLESGAQNVLDAMNKGISADSASRALTNLKAAGIGTYVYLLFGTPHEDHASALKTMDFVIRHAECISFLNAALFNMPFRSPERALFDTNPFYEGDLTLYTDFEHPLGWNRRRVRDFLDREFKRHPVIADILRRTPPVFTSNHAPFFLDGNR